MKIKTAVQNAILKITRRIQKWFPDLSKYINEMHVTIRDTAKPGGTTQNLSEYYDSPFNILKQYDVNHEVAKKHIQNNIVGNSQITVIEKSSSD